MKISDIDNFWGSVGAGCILISKKTKRLCMSHRSPYVNEPNTWGLWGGKIDDSDSSPKNALLRELQEESGYSGNIDLVPLYTYRNSDRTFTYYNFLGIIDDEFSPNLDWENQGYRWFEYGNWPNPLHPGVAELLRDPKSIKTIESYLKRFADK